MAMTDWTIIRRSMTSRLFSTVTTVITVAIAVGLMLTLLSMRDSGRRAFERGSGNMHMLISNDSSPLVSVLNGIFYANAPARAITPARFAEIANSFPAEYAIPTQLGDRYMGLPVLATTREFFTKFSPNPDFKPGSAELGWKLAEVVDGSAPDSLLDSYHAERHAAAARVLRTTMALTALERGDAPRVFEDGGQRRDFVHVRDVSAANVAALTVEQPHVGSLNVASGHPRTVLDLAAALASAMGGPPPEVTGDFRLGDVRHVTASSARAAESLGFRAQVGFEAGVAEFATAPLRPGAPVATYP